MMTILRAEIVLYREEVKLVNISPFREPVKIKISSTLTPIKAIGGTPRLQMSFMIVE
jgi:hypothetical protein